MTKKEMEDLKKAIIDMMNALDCNSNNCKVLKEVYLTILHKSK